MCQIPNCNSQTRITKGYCEKHYKRFLTHGDANFSYFSPEYQAKRFWAKVDIGFSGQCWEWQGRKDKNGYGVMAVRIKGQKITFAHRLSYFFQFGRLPQNLKVCHQCDNPSCVNPNHLFLGTQQDNLADMVQKRRHGFGERNAMAKLKESDVLKIRKLLSQGLTKTSIAKQFNVTDMVVGKISRRELWKHI